MTSSSESADVWPLWKLLEASDTEPALSPKDDPLDEFSNAFEKKAPKRAKTEQTDASSPKCIPSPELQKHFDSWPAMLEYAFSDELPRLRSGVAWKLQTGCSGTDSPILAMEVPCIVNMPLQASVGLHVASQESCQERA